MNAIFPFDFEGRPIRVLDVEGEPWFVAADLGAALELSNPRKAVADLDGDEKGVTVGDTPGGQQSLNTVNESGLYHLIFKSRKPAAKRFRKWVTSEVLPAIRKTGKFEVDSAVREIEEDVADRMTIPQFLKGRSALSFEGLCAFGAMVRRSNQALGCSYVKEVHPTLGRVRSYSLDILEFAWERFLRQHREVGQLALPGLDGLGLVESEGRSAA